MSDKKEQRNNLRPAWQPTKKEQSTEKKIIIDNPPKTKKDKK